MSATARAEVRAETPGDAPAIEALLRAAFPGDDEARLVAALRDAGALNLSLVAEEAGAIVGHTGFSPLAIEGAPAKALALAPHAVAPARQRCGLGSALVRAGLDAARAGGWDLVVVLGEPAYYQRFGFAPASEVGLACPFAGAGAAYQALCLGGGRPDFAGALPRYHGAFAGL